MYCQYIERLPYAARAVWSPAHTTQWTFIRIKTELVDLRAEYRRQGKIHSRITRWNCSTFCSLRRRLYHPLASRRQKRSPFGIAYYIAIWGQKWRETFDVDIAAFPCPTVVLTDRGDAYDQHAFIVNGATEIMMIPGDRCIGQSASSFQQITTSHNTILIVKFG